MNYLGLKHCWLNVAKSKVLIIITFYFNLGLVVSVLQAVLDFAAVKACIVVYQSIQSEGEISWRGGIIQQWRPAFIQLTHLYPLTTGHQDLCLSVWWKKAPFDSWLGQYNMSAQRRGPGQTHQAGQSQGAPQNSRHWGAIRNGHLQERGLIWEKDKYDLRYSSTDSLILNWMFSIQSF